MATQKQIEANRRNAQKSTGPKTEEGKAKASLNSLKHGMTAETAVLPYEDSISYDLLRATLFDEYKPVGVGEEMLVELIANNYWRLLRARRVETASLDLHIRAMKSRNDIDDSPSVDDDTSLGAAFARCSDTLLKLERYQNTIERSYLRAVEALRKAQNDRRRQEKIGSVLQKPKPQYSTINIAQAVNPRGYAKWLKEQARSEAPEAGVVKNRPDPLLAA